MYSRIAGTRRVNASSGSQIRAARRAPSASSIHWFSISRTARGNWSMVFTRCSPKQISRKPAVMGERLHRLGDGMETRHGRPAVVAGPHMAVGECRLAPQGGGDAGMLKSAVIKHAIVVQRVMARHGDEGRRQA